MLITTRREVNKGDTAGGGQNVVCVLNVCLHLTDPELIKDNYITSSTNETFVLHSMRASCCRRCLSPSAPCAE